MSLKNYLQADLNTFISQDEFATLHTIDGHELSIVVDEDRLMERAGKEFEGITAGKVLYFVKVSDWGTQKPRIDEIQMYDKQRYFIIDVREDMGLYEILIGQNRGE
jgi:hypothetical protein